MRSVTPTVCFFKMFCFSVSNFYSLKKTGEEKSTSEIYLGSINKHGGRQCSCLAE